MHNTHTHAREIFIGGLAVGRKLNGVYGMNGRECLRPQRLMDQLSVHGRHAGFLKAHINT